MPIRLKYSRKKELQGRQVPGLEEKSRQAVECKTSCNPCSGWSSWYGYESVGRIYKENRCGCVCGTTTEGLLARNS